MKLKEKLNEASPIEFGEVDDSKKKLIQDILGKKDAEKQSYHDGIHGTIVSFNSIMGDKIRVNKKSLQKILKDKNVRWVDISAIGF